MKPRTLTMTIALLCCLQSVSVAQGEEAKEAALKAWGKFTGKWHVKLDENESFNSTIKKSQDGSCFIHQNPHLTHVVGWDAEQKKLRGQLFFADGGHGVSLWTLTGDGPKFEGTLSMVDNDGKRNEFTGTLTFSGPDHWKGVFEGETIFESSRRD